MTAQARECYDRKRALLLITTGLNDAVFILLLSVAIAAVYHILFPAGFFVDCGGVSEVWKAHLADTLPRVHLLEVVNSLKQTGAVFVDARREEQYNEGHIPDAINLPPGCSGETKLSSLAGVPRSAHIIVYCQSGGCPYGKRLAADLVVRGYSHVELYEEGWQEWEVYQIRQRRRAPR